MNTPTVFSFNGFQFDTRRRELRTPGNIIIQLSRTEFELLNIFGRQPSVVFDRSIDLHVSRLRSKLGPMLGYESFIKTVRGAGYMFILEVTKGL